MSEKISRCSFVGGLVAATMLADPGESAAAGPKAERLRKRQKVVRFGKKRNVMLPKRLPGGSRAGESSVANFGDITISGTNGTALCKLGSFIVTLYKATNNSGGYDAYQTVTFTVTSLGWSTHAGYGNGYQGGLYIIVNELTAANGLLLTWSLPEIDVQCGESANPYNYQRSIDPDIFNLAVTCQFETSGRPDGQPDMWQRC
jgi:hypothetical protein